MQEAFDLAEHALVLAIQATDNALGEAIEHGCCATEYPDFVTAVMEFAGRDLCLKTRKISLTERLYRPDSTRLRALASI